MRSLVFCSVIAAATPALACVDVPATTGIANLVPLGCWLLGSMLCFTALYRAVTACKLKLQNQPSRPAQADAAMSLMAGLFLLAFPFVQAAMQGTITPAPQSYSITIEE